MLNWIKIFLFPPFYNRDYSVWQLYFIGMLSPWYNYYVGNFLNLSEGNSHIEIRIIIFHYVRSHTEKIFLPRRQFQHTFGVMAWAYRESKPGVFMLFPKSEKRGTTHSSPWTDAICQVRSPLECKFPSFFETTSFTLIPRLWHIIAPRSPSFFKS